MLKLKISRFLTAVLIACAGVAAAAAEREFALEYGLDLRTAPAPAQVALVVRQKTGALRRLRFDATTVRFTNFAADGTLERDGDQYVWTVPPTGGRLTWRAPVTHMRDDTQVDAKLGKRWALFRGEDVFPAMASVALKGATATATLQVELPKSWSIVTPFAEHESGYLIDNPARRFDRPTGWIAAGRLGVRIDRVAGMRVTVAAPTGQEVRRQDMLALLNWSVPDLLRVLPDFPSELLVVSAGDPFWRGGLSGPGSLYVHAQRPLISENGTSTLLHELFHVGFGRYGARRDDWIVEGLAEFYSVEILRRSGTVTERRHAKTLRGLHRWGKKAPGLRVPRANGAVTARAVGVFVALDKEIRERSHGTKSLDDVVRRLVAASGPLSLDELRAAVAAEVGAGGKVLLKLDEQVDQG